MSNENVFQQFDEGALVLPDGEKKFSDLGWNRHPVFDGVELKHIVTSADTNGAFSFHLVRIAPGKSIKNHVHEKQLETHEVIAGSGVLINDDIKITYEPGIISIMPKGIAHEVNAGEEGLYLFAKFFPALC